MKAYYLVMSHSDEDGVFCLGSAPSGGYVRKEANITLCLFYLESFRNCYTESKSEWPNETFYDQGWKSGLYLFQRFRCPEICHNPRITDTWPGKLWLIFFCRGNRKRKQVCWTHAITLATLLLGIFMPSWITRVLLFILFF